MPHHHDPDHRHPQRHAPQPDEEDTSPREHRRLEAAVRELLVEKGLFTADELRQVLERFDSQTPALGARVVARAWIDPDYRARLLADGSVAVAELGIDMEGVKLVVVENTPEVHNLIVCTLCSCYPRPVLGLPPDWYKSRAYRSRAVREPRELLREFGTVLAEGTVLRVHDSSADMRYLVLPMRPAGTDGMGEAELAEMVTRDSMIGVSLPRQFHTSPG
jgi:nitrile hydratase